MGLSPFSYSARHLLFVPEFPPCDPISDPSQDRPVMDRIDHGEDVLKSVLLPELNFCAKWNPEFAFNGHHCCSKTARTSRKRRRMSCSIQRAKGNYCGEITPEQDEYTRLASSGQLGDILELINQDQGKASDQAYCTVNNGFLAWGRRLIPSEENRISLRAPGRCTDFGTDSMIGMLEWVGRKVKKEYSVPQYQGTHLVVGDISAPRGGCLSGRGGRRGHLSHTTGQDVDVSFLMARVGKSSPLNFHREFDAKQNWQLLKQFFKNPYACIKVIFLDKRLIKKLTQVAQKDEEWSTYRRFIRHMPGHRNHFHIRVGDGPGLPGCVSNPQPELELEDGGDGFELDFLDEVDFVSRSPLLLHRSAASIPAAVDGALSTSSRPSSEAVNVQE